MKISRNELRRIIVESLLIEQLKKNELISLLTKSQRPFDFKNASIIKNSINNGIVGSTGSVRKGQQAVAYLAHEIFPLIMKTKEIAPNSPQAIKLTFEFLQEFGAPGLAEELAKILPRLDSPNYLAKILSKNPTPAVKAVIEKIGGVEAVLASLNQSGALTQPVQQATNAMTSALQRPRPLRVIITKEELKAAQEAIKKTAPNVARDIVKGAKPLSNANTQAASVVDDVAAEALKQGPKAAKFARFLKLAGPVGLVLTVIDAFLIPYNLFANGEFMGFKIGMGLSDINTPWGQLTYRRKVMRKPAKPSDFDNEYKNLIAGLIWNQNKDPQAKEFVTTAIKEDLIDLPAWKEYLAPMREAEKKFKEINEEFAGEEGAGESDEVYDFVDLKKIQNLGTTDGRESSPATSPTNQGSKSKEWENYIEKTKEKESAIKISKIWSKVAKLDLINASPDYAGFVDWYKKTKNDGEIMSSLNKNKGEDFTPEEALKLIDAAGRDEAVKEHFGKSHATLIRERYRMRY